MSTRTTVVVGLLCLALSAATFAQGFTQGDKVLTLSGTGQNDNDFADFIFSIEGQFGYFFTNNIEGLFQQNIDWVDVPGSDDDWGGATRVGLRYNWDMGRLWPFVGADLGYIYGDRVRDTWTAGPEAGVRYFVNETTFILGQVQYEFFFRNTSDVNHAFDDGRWLYTLGMGFRW
jgi:hypothetical protein